MIIALDAEDMLREIGVSTVHTAPSVEAAFRLLDEHQFDMALLDVEESAVEVDRDPFRYGRVPPPTPAPAKVPPRPPPQPPPKAPEPTGPVPPTPPPFTHTYLGSFGSVGLRIAVFEDQEGTVVNAFEGEVMEGKFKVLKIGFESVDIEFVGFPDKPAKRLEIGG